MTTDDVDSFYFDEINYYVTLSLERKQWNNKYTVKRTRGFARRGLCPIATHYYSTSGIERRNRSKTIRNQQSNVFTARCDSFAGGGYDARCAGVRGEQEQRLPLPDVGRAGSAPQSNAGERKKEWGMKNRMRYYGFERKCCAL